MSAHVSQNFRLFELLKSGEPVSIDVIQAGLGIKKVSVAVYISEFKHHNKAVIETVYGEKVVGRRGRGAAVAYKLLNANDLKIPQFHGTTPVTNKAPVAVKPAEELEIVASEYDEKEMADTRAVLGIDLPVAEGSY